MPVTQGNQGQRNQDQHTQDQHTQDQRNQDQRNQDPRANSPYVPNAGGVPRANPAAPVQGVQRPVNPQTGNPQVNQNPPANNTISNIRNLWPPEFSQRAGRCSRQFQQQNGPTRTRIITDGSSSKTGSRWRRACNRMAGLLRLRKAPRSRHGPTTSTQQPATKLSATAAAQSAAAKGRLHRRTGRTYDRLNPIGTRM